MNRRTFERVKDIFSKKNLPDEKTWIVKKEETATDNGSIAKDLLGAKMAKLGGESINMGGEGQIEEELYKMSFFRKIVFFLSIIFAVFHVLFFAVILPCRQDPGCRNLERMWRSSVLVGNLSTNPAILELNGQPSLVLLSHTNSTSGDQSLTALNASNGGTVWQRPLDFEPKELLCSCKGYFLDANDDGAADCLIVGEDTLTAVSAFNGYTLWQKNVTAVALEHVMVIAETNSTSVSKILVVISRNFGEKIGKKADELLQLGILDLSDGEILRRIDTPCRKDEELSTLDLLAPRLRDGVAPGAVLALACASQNATDLFLFSTDFLNPVLLGNNYRKFKFPFHFGPTASGHFTNLERQQLAVTERIDSNFTIRILESDIGSVATSTPVGAWAVISLWKITSRSNSFDSILLEAQSLRDKNRSSNEKDQLTNQRHYMLLQGGPTTKLSDLCTSEDVYDSAVSVSPEGLVSLFAASADGSITKYEMKILT